MITKEKILAIASGVLALSMLAGMRLPKVEGMPNVPPEEKPRSYRAVSATPRLAPEKPFAIVRDPFRVKDPWQLADPALLAVPPSRAWARAYPGGVAPRPRGPNDRLLLETEPKAVVEEEQ